MISRNSLGRYHIHDVHEDGHTHLGWDRSLKPILRIQPGKEVYFNVLESSGGRLTYDSTSTDVAKLSAEKANPVTGPIYIEGADPGMTLVVEILSFGAARWGWTAIIPGFGLLTDQFPDPVLITSKVRNDELDFLGGLRIPAKPFAGTMGVAPSEPGRHSIIPPRITGGNMDVRHLTAGSTLYLPIQVPGALFSVGDSHAAQGDGEVCGTAVESPIDVVMRFKLSDRMIKAPEFRLPSSGLKDDPIGYHVTTGIGDNLMQAARDAVSHMIDYLGHEHQLSAEHAYMLCSVAADLSISEIVDAPNWVISLRMPLSIFK